VGKERNVTPRELEAARTELKRRRLAIVEATRRVDAELDGLRGAERGPELEEEAQTEQGLADVHRLGEAERLELKRIDVALQRLEAGTYGVCAECGAPIEPKRLKALPSAVRCASCAAAQERTGTR
jgi:DnaK suppressor protein